MLQIPRYATHTWTHVPTPWPSGQRWMSSETIASTRAVPKTMRVRSIASIESVHPHSRRVFATRPCRRRRDGRRCRKAAHPSPRGASGRAGATGRGSGGIQGGVPIRFNGPNQGITSGGGGASETPSTHVIGQPWAPLRHEGSIGQRCDRTSHRRSRRRECRRGGRGSSPSSRTEGGAQHEREGFRRCVSFHPRSPASIRGQISAVHSHLATWQFSTSEILHYVRFRPTVASTDRIFDVVRLRGASHHALVFALFSSDGWRRTSLQSTSTTGMVHVDLPSRMDGPDPIRG